MSRGLFSLGAAAARAARASGARRGAAAAFSTAPAWQGRPIASYDAWHGLRREVELCRTLIPAASVFATLQYRSGMTILQLLRESAFEEPEVMATMMTGLVRGVNRGLHVNRHGQFHGSDGHGEHHLSVFSQAGTYSWHHHAPHAATIIAGSFVHIPEDIVEGLRFARQEHGRLPTPLDYRNMYAAVRASMQTVSADLWREVGLNTTSVGINALEGIIRVSGRDPVQAFRDMYYWAHAGEEAGPEGGFLSWAEDRLPPDLWIARALDIQEDFRNMPIIRSVEGFDRRTIDEIVNPNRGGHPGISHVPDDL